MVSHSVELYPGAFVSRVARYIAEVNEKEKIEPNTGDKTQLGMIKLPVETALQTLYDLAGKGLNVSAQAIFGVIDILKHYELPINLSNKSDSSRKPELVWSLNSESTPVQQQTVFQKLGNAMMRHFKQWDLFVQPA